MRFGRIQLLAQLNRLLARIRRVDEVPDKEARVLLTREVRHREPQLLAEDRAAAGVEVHVLAETPRAVGLLEDAVDDVRGRHVGEHSDDLLHFLLAIGSHHHLELIV